MHHNPGFIKLVEQVKERIKECTAEEVQVHIAQGEKFYFIDVREDHEYWIDHAAGARHLGKGILERDIESVVPDRNASIVLYCGGGYRSVLAADALQQMGYRNVVSMKGGIKAWRDAAFPLEKDKAI
ncbi:MAG: rhodanese-like domain-containing protein [Nitrosomonas sp.]